VNIAITKIHQGKFIIKNFATILILQIFFKPIVSQTKSRRAAQPVCKSSVAFTVSDDAADGLLRTLADERKTGPEILLGPIL
jgi:hypothetical protein